MIVSESGVHVGVPFSVSLVVPKWVADSVPHQHILRVGLDAAVRTVNAPNVDVTNCRCTNGKPLIKITISKGNPFKPIPFTSPPQPPTSEESVEEGHEERVSFLFDRCHSRCTSSKSHHNSKMMLVVKNLHPTIPEIFSSPFSFHPRIKRTSQQHPPPQRQQMTMQTQQQQSMMMCGGGGGVVSALTGSVVMMTRRPVVVKVMTTVLSPPQLELVIHSWRQLSRPSPSTTTTTTTQQEQQQQQRGRQVVSAGSQITAGEAGSLVISFNVCETVEASEQFNALARAFVANTLPHTKNPFNRPLLNTDLGQLIAVYTSY